MSKAKNGDKVKVHYKGTLEDGTVFDSSEGRDPLEFTIGEGRVIPGFEQAVDGLAVKESRTVAIPCAEAYGERREELIQEVPRDQFPEDMKVEQGQRLQLSLHDGQQMVVEVTSMTDASVTLDANHPLAGKDLNFEIELVEIL